jgi:hypothetical protein
MTRRIFMVAAIALLALICQGSYIPSQAKGQPFDVKTIVKAPPQEVFQVIQQLRGSHKLHRKVLSYDGKVAKFEENLEGVVIYGKVNNIWEEIEESPNHIQFKLVSSSKFKEAFGSWTVKPAADGKGTELHLSFYLDSGLRIPFAHQITQAAAERDAKERLELIKQLAENSKQAISFFGQDKQN